ncbi:hypothetical protein BD769DRAFT_1399263 [Suillus cothurnatus]|nr:hypothetical protein BD769DRAFT_1399263 [Suillus cothurnatus]
MTNVKKRRRRQVKTAIQEGHKCIAAFQKQMQANQATVCTDAPKPTHPHPRPVKKGAKALETSNLTTAAEKAVGAKGKGGRAAASANVEHPASEDDEELEVQMPEACKKKGKRTVILVKTPVRDAINVAHDDESSDAIDGNSSMQAPKNTVWSIASQFGGREFPSRALSSPHLYVKIKGCSGRQNFSQGPREFSTSMNLAHRNAKVALKQLNPIEPDVTAETTKAKTTPQMASLVDYGSDTDRESDLDLLLLHRFPKGIMMISDPHVSLELTHTALPVSSTNLQMSRMALTDDSLIEDDLMIKDNLIIEDNLVDEAKSLKKVEIRVERSSQEEASTFSTKTALWQVDGKLVVTVLRVPYLFLWGSYLVASSEKGRSRNV